MQIVKKYLRIYVSKSVSGHPLIIYVGDAMLCADCLVAAINIINFCVVFLRSIRESRQSNLCVRPSSLLISVITQLSMFIAMSFTLSLSTSFLLGCTITWSYTFLSTVASMCCSFLLFLLVHIACWQIVEDKTFFLRFFLRWSRRSWVWGHFATQATF